MLNNSFHPSVFCSRFLKITCVTCWTQIKTQAEKKVEEMLDINITNKLKLFPVDRRGASLFKRHVYIGTGKTAEMLAEEYRQERQRQIDLMIQKKAEQRYGIMPYMQLCLEDDGIDFKSDKVTLRIGLTNIGKGTAIDIGIPSLGRDTMGMYCYVQEIGRQIKNAYPMYRYLNCQYAAAGGRVYFEINHEYEKNEDRYKTLYFKCSYKDLIGNLYEQKFQFSYCSTHTVKGYLPNQINDRPILVQEV